MPTFTFGTDYDSSFYTEMAVVKNADDNNWYAPRLGDAASGVSVETRDANSQVAGPTVSPNEQGFFDPFTYTDDAATGVLEWRQVGSPDWKGPVVSRELLVSLGVMGQSTAQATSSANAAAAQALATVQDAQEATQEAQAAAQTAQTAAQAAQAAAAGSTYFVRRKTGGVYPPRGRTDGAAEWQSTDGVPPAVTTGYAQAGDKYVRLAS